MAVEGCHRFMKYVLIGFNVVVLLLGIAAVALGAWAYASDYGADEMDEILGSDLYLAGCVVIMAGGIIVVLVSFLGCCGALCENRCLLGTYFIIMLLILILFVVGGVLAFFYRDEIEKKLEEGMEDTLRKDYDNTDASNHQDIKDVWDKIQSELHCCGVSGGLKSKKSWYLWQDSVFFNSQTALDKQMVPGSCCNKEDFTFDECQMETALSSQMPPKTNTALVYEDNPALYTDGCLSKVKDKIEDNIVAIAAVAVAVFVVIFLCVVFSVCVCMEIRKEHKIV